MRIPRLHCVRMLAQINPEIGELVAADSHVIGVEWANAVFVQLMEQVRVNETVRHIIQRQADGSARNIIAGEADALAVADLHGSISEHADITCPLIPYLHIADDDVLTPVQRDTVRFAVLDDEWSIGGELLALIGDGGHKCSFMRLWLRLCSQLHLM